MSSMFQEVVATGAY
jgi:septal ring factor EnvC (AmiA/AmiB activator)